ncbi:MAG: aminotransferase class I/II-fold pyridoxal phosphate-dependent enzyme [Nitrososphaera sp.]|nr:aminotransferase class I/II-fold pyridoxal phosphate-dependent enzyme [Nitrososphaera sp.]
MGKNDELESLRERVRNVTGNIMREVYLRLELAKQIGEIKERLGIEIKDERVEQEIKMKVLDLAGELGMKKDFALRLLNILLEESEGVQSKKRKLPEMQTHLGIFMKAKRLEEEGKKIIHMEVGEPDYSPPASVGKALSDSFLQRQYHYTDTRGIPKLREALSNKVGVAEDQLIVTPGGRFAVFSAIAGLLKGGQELVLIEPAWPAYRECADLIGAKTKVLKTTLEDKWNPDIRHLEEMISPATKMLVLNYPNNPTGKILESKFIDKIVSLARDHDLYLLSDEVYADYAFYKKFDSILTYGYDKSVMVSSFSKRYAMTGFRVGYGVANREVIAKMAKVQAAGITSVAEPMQQAALEALGQDYAENVKVMKERLAFVSKKLKEMSLRFVEPEGAMYVYPEIPSSDDIELVQKLLLKGVAIAPGSGFGESYNKFVRVSACQPTETLAKGLEIMAAVIRESR